MPLPNTLISLRRELSEAGLRPGMTVMVHSSLGQVGWTVVFDPSTTPTTMGAVPEAFRTFPSTRRSVHPLVSVCANGLNAEAITDHHSLEFCEGKGTPFETLYDLGAHTLLLGVGFNRCSSLHYAESLVWRCRTWHTTMAFIFRR